MYSWSSQIISELKSGGVGVLPTDTLYGLVGSALDKNVVERIYLLKKRGHAKPLIVLISDLKDLEKFGVELVDDLRGKLSKLWPAQVSVVLPTTANEYLHRGTNTIAFRMPNDEALLGLLKKVGPLVAPSANVEGELPATNIKTAHQYFGGTIDFYVDGGELTGKPSSLILVTAKREVKIKRAGADLDKVRAIFIS